MIERKDKEIEEKARKDSMSYVDNGLKINLIDVKWLRNAYISNEQTIEVLRHHYQTLCEKVLSWPEIQNREFTVEDAQWLNCCRICKQSYGTVKGRGVFVLNCGKEFAHEECLKEICPHCRKNLKTPPKE